MDLDDATKQESCPNHCDGKATWSEIFKVSNRKLFELLKYTLNANIHYEWNGLCAFQDNSLKGGRNENLFFPALSSAVIDPKCKIKVISEQNTIMVSILENVMIVPLGIYCG